MSAVGDPRSRRREAGASSARSLLLTVLGEFVLPAAEPVWTRTLVDVLAVVGVEEKSARQALARVAADDVVAAERRGRRVRWSLSPAGLELLTTGAARIYGHGARRPGWDGRWLVVVASVPEQQRALRHRLRTRLAWVGLGSPTAGVWVRPWTEEPDDPDGRDLDAVRAVLDELDLAGSAHVVVGDYRGGLDPTDLAQAAWDLTDLDARYRAFVDRFADLSPVDDTAALAAQIRLVDDWRRFPFLDPQLPDALLPAAWPGHDAARTFHERHADWAPGADRAWRAAAATAGDQGS